VAVNGVFVGLLAARIADIKAKGLHDPRGRARDKNGVYQVVAVPQAQQLAMH
jgi:hypothetical protein